VDALAKQLGQSVIVENRGGAGGNIAMGVAARAKPDGYTLLLTSSVLVVNPLLYKTVPFDPARDFVPISLLGTSPNLMAALPGFANTMVEFIAKAKARPGQLNYSTPGIGTKGHFAVELLKLRAGIDVVHVPYASGGQVVQSLLTGTTQLGSTALPAGEPLVRGGTLAGLVVSGKTRWSTLPGVPTMVELGYPDFVAEIFTALFAPAGTPPEVVNLLTAEVAKLSKDPGVIERAERAGYEWIGAGPDAVRGACPLHIHAGSERILLDERSARLDLVAHQFIEHGVGVRDVLDVHLQEGACVDVERGFPELPGIHLPQPLVALQRKALAAGIGHGVEESDRPVNRFLLVLATEQAGPPICFLQ
jgi:tripartite-type tricarboxylate transporter receptor subunit TctC